MDNNASTLKSVLYRFLDSLNNEGLGPAQIVDTVNIFITELTDDQQASESLDDAVSYLQRNYEREL